MTLEERVADLEARLKRLEHAETKRKRSARPGVMGGEELRRARKQASWTVTTFCAAWGRSKSALYQLESNCRTISQETADELITIFKHNNEKPPRLIKEVP
ncbi:MAG: helix-turn-helix transcriptional regulator [Gemmatimonadaceae bacterium]|nr:helix-turn-helix transcriptional regulator [Gemmatimonadaceae bacterium]